MSPKPNPFHQLELGKIPPQDVPLEEVVLGNILSNPPLVLYYNKILFKECFYKEAHQILYETLLELSKESESVDLMIVINAIKKKELLDIVGGAYYITTLMSKAILSNENSYMKHSLILFEHYAKREIIRFSIQSNAKAYDESTDIFSLLEEIKSEIESIDSKMSFNTINNVSAIHQALDHIEDRASGKVLSYAKTGFDKFDHAFYLDKKQIIVIAGQKGHMKSKKTIAIVQGLITHNKNVSAQIWTLEEPAYKIVRNIVSKNLHIEDQRLMSRSNKKLTAEEREAIKAELKRLEEQDIEYVEKAGTIISIANSFRLFCKKRPDNLNVLVIDNLGLVNHPSDMKQSIEIDAYIAKEIVNIRDETNGLIIVVHHLTKSQLSRLNIDTGYRPREEDVRGNARILDYANSVMLVNFIGKYKDLVQLEKEKIYNLKIDHDNFPNGYLLNFNKINSEQDAKHAQYSADAYISGLRNTINLLMNPTKLRIDFPTVDPKVAAEKIIDKYLQAIIYMEGVNRARKKGYESKMMDPLTYLNDGHYKKPLKLNKESKEWYLYGNDPGKYRPMIDNLFILDGVKIREGAIADEEVVIRYFADGNYNSFEEL